MLLVSSGNENVVQVIQLIKNILIENEIMLMTIQFHAIVALEHWSDDSLNRSVRVKKSVALRLGGHGFESHLK